MSDLNNEENVNEEMNSIQPTVGEQLRGLRESKGYSLKYISQQTKISVRILENIESSNYKELPNTTYVTGFLRSYCRILGADANTLIDDFIAEADTNKSNAKSKQQNNSTENYQSISQKQVMALLGVIIIAGIFVGIYKVIGNVSSTGEEVAKTPDGVVLESITASTPLAKEEQPMAEADADADETVEEEVGTNQNVDTAAVATTTPTSDGEPKTISPAPERTPIIDIKKQFDHDQTEAEKNRLANEKKLAEEQRLQEQKLAKEKKLEEKKKAAEAKKLAEEKKQAEAKKLAEEKKQAQAKKLAEEKKQAQAKKLAEEKKQAEAKKLAEEKKQAEAKKLAEEKKAAEDKKQKNDTSSKEKDKKEFSFSDFNLPLYQYEPTDVDDIPEDELPKTYRQSVIKGKENIFINAINGDTWITYKADDKKVKKFVLKQGRRILIRGEVIRIFMGNINATKMFHNNRPLIVDSKSGVRSLVFPQELSTNFKIPLFIYKDDGTVQTSEDYLSESETATP